MSHYYTENPDTISKPSYYETTIYDRLFKFETDNGVFCKGYLDFGSRVLLENLEIPSVSGDILDLGCGYGPMGIAVAYKSKRNVLLCDINQRAVLLANKNIEENKIINAVATKSNIYENITRNFALIITNPPIRAGKSIVHEFFLGSYSHLVNDGELWVVIQKKQGAPSAIKKLEEIFGNCSIIAKEKGYYILKSKKIEENSSNNIDKLAK